jgi:two-component system, LytTR family, response regulator
METRGLLDVLVAAPVPALNTPLVGLLRHSPFVRVTHTTSSLDESRAFLSKTRVDLVLIDVDLPGGGGFALARSIPSDVTSDVVFIACDGAQAIEAFRYRPLDYLVYPVNSDRLNDALGRAMDRSLIRRLERGDRSIPDMLQRARQGVRSVLRLMVKTAGRISFVKAEDIDWVEAERDYVRIYNAGKKHLLRERISRLEQQLPRERFLRIHRSTIVNIDRIKELQPLSFGEYSVILHDGTRLTMSRSFRDRVFERLQSAA